MLGMPGVSANGALPLAQDGHSRGRQALALFGRAAAGSPANRGPSRAALAVFLPPPPEKGKWKSSVG